MVNNLKLSKCTLVNNSQPQCCQMKCSADVSNNYAEMGKKEAGWEICADSLIMSMKMVFHTHKGLITFKWLWLKRNSMSTWLFSVFVFFHINGHVKKDFSQCCLPATKSPRLVTFLSLLGQTDSITDLRKSHLCYETSFICLFNKWIYPGKINSFYLMWLIFIQPVI